MTGEGHETEWNASPSQGTYMHTFQQTLELNSKNKEECKKT